MYVAKTNMTADKITVTITYGPNEFVKTVNRGMTVEDMFNNGSWMNYMGVDPENSVATIGGESLDEDFVFCDGDHIVISTKAHEKA